MTTDLQSARTTVHIFALDAFGSSRIFVQRNWEKNSFLVHRPGRHPAPSTSPTDAQSVCLSFRSVLDVLARFGDRGSFVFHGQSTLPYLLLARVALALRRSRQRPRFVYDVHDLNEPEPATTFWQVIRYRWIRHYILGWLERWAVSDPSLIVLAVSQGMADCLERQYGCRRPAVVMSVPPACQNRSPMTRRDCTTRWCTSGWRIVRRGTSSIRC